MQAEPVLAGFLKEAAGAVEGVAVDGKAESFGVCAVHAQLMGPARARVQGHEALEAFGGVLDADHLVVGEGLAAAFGDGQHALLRALEPVKRDREGD